MRLKALGLALCLAAAAAPFQCPGDPDPQLRREDSAPEAVWRVAERLRQRGQEQARRETLRLLVERYPSSRFAERARLVLRGPEPAEPPADAPSAPAPAPERP